MPRTGFLAGLLLALAPAPQAHASDPPVRLPKMVEGRLDNALHVVVCPMAGAPKVLVRVGVLAGPLTEPDDAHAGVSDLLARVVASAAPAAGVEGDAPAPRAAGSGAEIGVDVELDHTVFAIDTDRNGLDEAFDALASRLARPDAYTDEDLAAARDALRAARAGADSAPAAMRLARDAAYPYDVGARTVLDEITPEDLRAYQEARYVPGNAVVCVVGDVDAGAVFNRARVAFADWKRGRLPAEPRIGARAPGGSRLRETPDGGGADGGAIAIAWPVPVLSTWDRAALGVLVQHVTGSSALSSAAMWSSQHPASPAGLEAVAVAAGHVGARAFENDVITLTARLAAEPLADAEVAAARRGYEAALLAPIGTPRGLASVLVTDYLATGDCRFRERLVRLARQVSPADVRTAASRYLDPAGAVFVVLDPRGEDQKDAQEGMTGTPKATPAVPTKK